MKYIVIIFPLLVLLLSILSGGILLWERISGFDLHSYLDTWQKQSLAQEATPLTSDAVRESLVTYRWQQGLPDYLSDETFCSTIFRVSEEHEDLLATIPCENCRSAGLLQVPRTTSIDQLIPALLADEQAWDVLHSESITNVCVAERDAFISVFFAERVLQDESGAVAQTNTSSEAVATRSRTDVQNFSEAALWSALLSYRSSHNVRPLELNEDVCRYARKRVQDHLDDFGTRPKESYPRADKYPLDAHEGFSEDAASGYVFEVTGKSRVAENLAYWPDAQYPHHVIEWGWDTSTEGHREAQLSEAYGWGCLTGKDGFYVAIFAE